MGAEDSIACVTPKSDENVAVKAPMGPKEGDTAQTIAHGKSPLTTKTATSIPQSKNHLRACCPMVDKTWALIMALSTEETVSKRTKPATIKMIDKKSIVCIILEHYESF